jgi:hypothetical protein
MKRSLILAALMAAVALPTVAGACHVVNVSGDASCNGWSLCTTVYFTSSVDQGSLAYTVTILDGLGEEITSFGETLTITHEPGAGNYEYCFEGVWDGEHQVADATVLLTSSLDGQTPTTFSFDLGCTVSDRKATFGALKAQYR